MPESLRMRLLCDLARLLADRPKFVGSDLDYIEVEFRTRRGRLIGTLPIEKALTALADDVYIYEEFDISYADKVGLVSC